MIGCFTDFSKGELPVVFGVEGDSMKQLSPPLWAGEGIDPYVCVCELFTMTTDSPPRAPPHQGLPHRLGFLPANIYDYRVLPSIIPFPTSERGNRVYADKGFDSSAIREEIQKAVFIPRVARRRTVTTP